MLRQILSNEEEDYLAQLQELADIEPDLESFEFLGYVAPGGLDLWVHDVAPAPSVDALLDKAGIERTIPGVEDSGHRMLLLSADGRLYIEKEDVFLSRLEAFTLAAEEFASEADDVAAVGQDPPFLSGAASQTASAPEGRNLSAAPRATGDTIHGTDGRTLSLSTSYPFRAMGVALFSRTSTSPLSHAQNAGSASMIGPRQAVTVAHTFTDGSNVDTALGVAPAVRGKIMVTILRRLGLPVPIHLKLPMVSEVFNGTTGRRTGTGTHTNTTMGPSSSMTARTLQAGYSSVTRRSLG